MQNNISIQKPEDYIDSSAIFSNANWSDENVVEKYYSNIGIYLTDEKPCYDYATLVQYIMSKIFIVRDKNSKMYIYNYTAGVYEICDEYNLSSVVRFIVNQGGKALYLKKLLGEIEAQLKSYTIPLIEAFDIGRYYTFSNQAYDVKKFKATEFSSKHLNLLKMQYECDESCNSHPVFDQFLDDFTCSNNDLKILLQEIAGYLFWPENDAQRSFIFLGPARSGKSTMAKLFALLLGGTDHGAVISTPLHELSSCFGLEGIEKAKAIITTESEKKEYVQTAIYKAIVSGDSVSLNEKHKRRTTVVPKCKILSFTNHMPQFSEADPSLERRLLIFPCEADVPRDKIDSNLLNKLQKELPALFNWAMEGLKRLKQSNWKFSETDAIKGIVKKYVFESDPLYKFISDAITVNENAKFMRFIDIQHVYEKWAHNNGYEIKMNRFGVQLVEHLESLNMKIQTSRQKGYEGVKGVEVRNIVT